MSNSMNINAPTKKSLNTFNHSQIKPVVEELNLNVENHNNDKKMNLTSNLVTEVIEGIDELILTKSEVSAIIRLNPAIPNITASDIKSIKSTATNGQFLVTLKNGTIYKISGGDGIVDAEVIGIGHEGTSAIVSLDSLPNNCNIGAVYLDGGNIVINTYYNDKPNYYNLPSDIDISNTRSITFTFETNSFNPTLKKVDLGSTYTVSYNNHYDIDLGYEAPNADYSLDGRTDNATAHLNYITVENHNTNTVDYYEDTSVNNRAGEYTLIATHNKNNNTTTYNVNYNVNDQHVEKSSTYQGGPDINWMGKYCTGQELR